MPILAKGIASLVDQPVAATVAEDSYEAEDLVKNIYIE